MFHRLKDISAVHRRQLQRIPRSNRYLQRDEKLRLSTTSVLKLLDTKIYQAKRRVDTSLRTLARGHIASQLRAVTTALEKPKVVVITGPTAVGKTNVSLLLAEALGGEIISADSVQVYKGLDVGSDKVRYSPSVHNRPQHSFRGIRGKESKLRVPTWLILERDLLYGC